MMEIVVEFVESRIVLPWLFNLRRDFSDDIQCRPYPG